jgi:CDP-diglyceride synthetase
MTFIAALFLAFPAFIGNMAPVLVDKWQLARSLAIPIDGGRRLRDRPIFGAHKTWRGILAAIIGGGIIGAIAFAIVLSFGDGVPRYDAILIGFSYGAYAGFLAIMGDLLKSLIKRQLGIASGKPFIPWDQLDYMILFLIGTYPLFSWEPQIALALLLVAFLGNLATNYVAFRYRIKSTPW